MKKNRIANLIMVVLIAVIVGVGAFAALRMSQQNEMVWGSEFHRTEIADNRLVSDEKSVQICTITIRCDTVFEHEEAMDAAKIPYVPNDGEILPVTVVEFEEGETVFDVLRRVCEASELQIEYSWSPLYDSYYVEGINHLYEFDCGIESGWMYQVNGWFPNYGCSAYELQGGEEIVWLYTCVGLGTDIGAKIPE